jgi:uncharacterized protein YxjI
MELWDHDRYLARRQLFALFGAKFWLEDPLGNRIGFVRQKAFKLKEDIRVFADDSQTRELLLIKARSIVDFGAAYDVVDPDTGKRLGTLRRKGFSSLLRDHWEILDETERPIGRLMEDSMGLALLRRFLSNLIPQRFHFEIGGRKLGALRQRFNPFILKYDVDFGDDHRRELPRPLGLAGVVLVLAIEGRQASA